MRKNIEVKETTIGQRIKEQRVRLGMTQEQLADKMCIPKPNISAYENDRIDFKASRLADLAKALFTTPDYLMGFENGEKGEGKQIADTIVALLSNIEDERMKRMLLVQIRAVAEMENN